MRKHERLAGSKEHRLRFEAEKPKPLSKLRHTESAADALSDLLANAVLPADETEEEENAGVQAARTGRQGAEFSTRRMSKQRQKKQIQRQYAAAQTGRQAEGIVVQGAGEAVFTPVQRTERKIEVFIRKNRGKLVILLLAGMMTYMLSSLSGCMPIAQSLLESLVIGTYPAEEDDLIAAERAYCEMEDALQDELDRYGEIHPGYDEVQVEQMDIWHDPYVLLALIVFGVFARGVFTSGRTTTERAQRELHTYAEQHETALADYPDALVQLYARNPDARDFVRDYPKKKNLTPTIDLSGLAGSETVPLLLQWDERWGYREYNESIIGLAGCGPTCLSMVTIYLTGDTTKDPLWMCQFAEEHQFNVPGSGSKWALISEGGRMLGLDVTQIPLDQDRIYRNLDVGNPIIVVVGPGDFTTDGHFLVLTGHDGDKITLNDPNSPTNSQKSWDYDTLAGQIQSLWVLRRAG